MDRERFLKNMRASKVPLVEVQIDGWDGPIYMCQQTIGDVRDIILRSEREKADEAEKKPDPLVLARAIARIVRDEKGALLFNEDDDAQMEDLMSAMADAAPLISKQIHDKYRELNSPGPAEVDAKGN